MPAGRPTKYKKIYCEDVVEHMSRGASLASFAASIGTHREVLWQWRQKHPEFDNACLSGVEVAQRWWENLANQIATGTIFDEKNEGRYNRHNAGMVMFIMKRRFKDYRDMVQEERAHGSDSKAANLNMDEIEKKIDAKLKRRSRNKRKT